MGGTGRLRPAVVVLTALQVEYEAMRLHMTGVEEVELPTGTRVDVGLVPGLDWRVVLAETGPTNTRAALVAQPTISHFGADAVFFVGVAGALKDDLRLGDVVVARKIYGYHSGRESTDGFNARPDPCEPTYRMDQLVRSVRRNRPWAFLSPEPEAADQPGVHLEPIASGDVLVGFHESETVLRIRRHYNDAVAVDMESHGVAHAARMHAGVEMLAIRGISDFAGPGKAVSDAAGAQRAASRNAAAFALRILRDLRPAPGVPAPRRSPAPPHIVSAGRPASPSTPNWESDAVVSIEGTEYLLYQEPGDPPREFLDGDVIRRQALARVVSDRRSRGSYVWLHQVEPADSRAGSGDEPLADLEQQAALGRELRGPGAVRLLRGARSATLELGWPSDAGSGTPAVTLRELLPEPSRPADPLRLYKVLHGLASVAAILEGLHTRGLSHRAISPTAVLVNGRQGALRDFGLATTPARPGENSSPHRAPEQRYGAVGQRPGPPTDVYLLGLLLYGAMTGRPPAFEPVPVPAGPETLSRATAGALRSDPAERPGISEFRGAVLDAARELAASPPSHR